MKYCYVDESGNADFDNIDENRYFVLTAFVIDENDFDSFNGLERRIKKQFFQNSEIKSSKLTDGVKRRTVLQLITISKFNTFSIIFDKKSIRNDGLLEPLNFYKYVNKHFYQELLSFYHNDIEIYADKIKTQNFQEEIELYLKENQLLPSLFTNFIFSDSKEQPLISFADLFAGSLRKLKSNELETTVYDSILSLFEKTEIHYFEIIGNIREIAENDKPQSSIDSQIEKINMKNIEKVIENLDRKEDEKFLKLQIFIKIIRFNLYIDSNKAYSKSELCESMQKYFSDVTEDNIVRELIPLARDYGIMIVGFSSGGYKLVSSQADLTEYINHSKNQIEPLLKRLNKCRKNIKKGTQNNIDIFQTPDYSLLKRLLDSYQIHNLDGIQST